MISIYVATSEAINGDYLPIYRTPEGRKVYDDTLATMNASFPQYVREIQGVADGAQVDFHKVSP